MSDAKVINGVLRASCEIVGPEEAHCPKDKGCPYCNHANAVDAYRAAGSPEVPDVPDAPIDAVEGLRWIAQQPCTMDAENASRDTECIETEACCTEWCLPCYAKGVLRGMPVSLPTVPVPDAEALEAAIEVLEAEPFAFQVNNDNARTVAAYLRAMKGDKP